MMRTILGVLDYDLTKVDVELNSTEKCQVGSILLSYKKSSP